MQGKGNSQNAALCTALNEIITTAVNCNVCTDVWHNLEPYTTALDWTALHCTAICEQALQCQAVLHRFISFTGNKVSDM